MDQQWSFSEVDSGDNDEEVNQLAYSQHAMAC
jgi:hypothetical protein